MNQKVIKDPIFEIEQVPLNELRNWIFTEEFNLKHTSRGFFTYVMTQQGSQKNLLISQNEIGLLAIFLKEKDNDFLNQKLLIQQKQEPGNNPLSQLSPAIQMTYSNLTGKHGGFGNNLKLVNKYFKNVIYSYIKHEQSDSFLYKKNLNMLAYYDSCYKDYLLDNPNNIWISIDKIIQYALLGDLIHSDTRSVLFLYFGKAIIKAKGLNMKKKINKKFFDNINLWNILNQKNWRFVNIRENTVYKNGSLYFNLENDNLDKRVISGYRIKSDNREIKHWDQPLIYIPRKVYDILYSVNEGKVLILISLNISSGILNNVEFFPSFSYFENDKFFKNINKYGGTLLHESSQTEEGGRFWKRTNLHRIILKKDLCEFKNDPNKMILSIPELLNLYENTNYISMELRSILFILFAYLLKKTCKFQ